MPTPTMSIQLSQRLYQPCPYGIEMDIPDQFKQIAVFFAYNRFVTVLKKMPRSLMP
jgi:hypothetical protein